VPQLSETEDLMKITLAKGKQAPPEAVQKLEQVLGCPISSDFRRFISENDGARPQDNSFPIGKNNSSGVRRFIPVSKILKERQYIDNIPDRAYPIAEDSFGNYVLLDEGTGGKVYFWDHEFEDDNITHLADSFDQFLSMLEPPDEDAINEKIKSMKVLSVWTHPDFDRIIKEQQKGKGK
jgi:hypothetical protein